MKIFSIIILFGILISNIFAAQKLSTEDLEKLSSLKIELQKSNDKLIENIWIKKYKNYLTYRIIEKELFNLRKDAKKYANWKGEKWQEISYQLKNKVKIKENELELMSEYKDSPIGNKIKPTDIKDIPEVTNPFSIIEAISFAKQLEYEKEQYKAINDELVNTFKALQSKEEILNSILIFDKDAKYKADLEEVRNSEKDFSMVVDIVSTTYSVYEKKIEEIIIEIENDVSDEIYRTAKIAFIIIVLFAISLGLKYVTKKYIEDDDQHYTTNKVISFGVIFLSVIVLIFSYIENASYLVTILGFASAGIAIALKDWFMSLFGWMAIMISGAIRVGDRVKVIKNGAEIVGDVLDISLFKISVREDVTYTTYTTNRRAGRVVFIPNNYIFTDLIANYTYNELRTVWDGIDIYITFDSNHKKAVEIARAIAEKHAVGYTELARKRLQKMKSKYVLRTVNPEPRIFTMMEPYGIVITTWYQANSYAALPLRSKISMDILDAFNKADDISIAYPTQTVKMSKFHGPSSVPMEDLADGTI